MLFWDNQPLFATNAPPPGYVPKTPSTTMPDYVNPDLGFARPSYEVPQNRNVGYDRPSYTVTTPVVGYDRPSYAQTVDEQLQDNRPSYAVAPHNDNVGYGRPSYTYGPHMSAEELAASIMAGKFGNGAARKAQLAQMGYSPEEIAAAQGLINQKMNSLKRNPRAAVASRGRTVPVAVAPVSAPVSAPPPQAYAYQNVPVPVSREPEWGTYDYYRKYVLKG